MAWLYLILVVLVLYTPVIGLSAPLLREDIEFALLGVRFAIPFTGSLRLLISSLVIWWVLWRGTRWLEDRTQFDVLRWLDDRLPFVHLRARWLYAFRPYLPTDVAVWLAQIGLWVSLIKIFIVCLLAVMVAFLIPELVGALPGVISWLVGHFAEVAWIQTAAGWMESALADWLKGPLLQWLYEALSNVLRFNLHASLLALSTLVLVAHRAHEAEKGERYRKDLQRMQQRRKEEQQDIVL